jgi:hypothetical protein
MRVNQTEPVAVTQVLAHQVAHQSGFAGPSLTQNVDMLKSVRKADAKGPVPIATVGSPDCGDAVSVPSHAFSVRHARLAHYTASRFNPAVVVSAPEGDFVDVGPLIS